MRAYLHSTNQELENASDTIDYTDLWARVRTYIERMEPSRQRSVSSTRPHGAIANFCKEYSIFRVTDNAAMMHSAPKYFAVDAQISSDYQNAAEMAEEFLRFYEEDAGGAEDLRRHLWEAFMRAATESANLPQRPEQTRRDLPPSATQVPSSARFLMTQDIPDQEPSDKEDSPRSNTRVSNPTTGHDSTSWHPSSAFAQGSRLPRKAITEPFAKHTRVRSEVRLSKEKAEEIPVTYWGGPPFPTNGDWYDVSENPKGSVQFRTARGHVQDSETLRGDIQNLETLMPKGSTNISIGLGSSQAFPQFHRVTQTKMSERIPSFYRNSHLCAEFLRAIFAKTDLSDTHGNAVMGMDELFKVWAKHALYTLSETSKMMLYTSEWPTKSTVLDQRFFGCLVVDLKVQVWEMTYAKTRDGVEHVENAKDTQKTENLDRSQASLTNATSTMFQATQLAELKLDRGHGMRGFVEWYTEILEWASKKYCAPYMERLADNSKLERWLNNEP